MVKQIESLVLVHIPRLSSQLALVLGEMLMASARDVDGAPPVLRAYQRMVDDLALLQKEVQDRLPGLSVPSETKQADRGLDGGWSAFHGWLSAISALQESVAPGVAREAQRILSTLFPDGLRFLQSAFQQEWAESNSRLKAIVERGYEQFITSHGGELVLASLRKAHEHYGKVLGITQGIVAPEPAEVRAALVRFTSSMRAYVLQVVAHATDAGENEMVAAEKRLRPLLEWPLSTPRKRASDGSDAEPQPEEPTAE